MKDEKREEIEGKTILKSVDQLNLWEWAIKGDNSCASIKIWIFEYFQRILCSNKPNQ